MRRLTLSNDRTEVDQYLLAKAFGLSREALDEALSLGTISYCYELPSGDTATPRAVFRSKESGQRVVLDRNGMMTAPQHNPSADQPLPCSESCRPDAARATNRSNVLGPPPKHTRAHDLDGLLDDALRETFPASDSVAISFDAPRPGS